MVKLPKKDVDWKLHAAALGKGDDEEPQRTMEHLAGGRYASEGGLLTGPALCASSQGWSGAHRRRTRRGLGDSGLYSYYLKHST